MLGKIKLQKNTFFYSITISIAIRCVRILSSKAATLHATNALKNRFAESAREVNQAISSISAF
jgi:hypothetical protein